MISVALTQRILRDDRHGEERDGLDRRWHRFLRACGLVGVPVPNDATAALSVAARCAVGGLILTGGGDLAEFGGDAAERDRTERALLDWAVTNRVPTLGVCRGMQQIAYVFGSRLVGCTGHAGVRHLVTTGDAGGSPLWRGVLGRSVNSYHDLAVESVRRPLEVAARCGGVIEALAHDHLPVAGVMWHPEREAQPDEADVRLFRRLFEERA